MFKRVSLCPHCHEQTIHWWRRVAMRLSCPACGGKCKLDSRFRGSTTFGLVILLLGALVIAALLKHRNTLFWILASIWLLVVLGDALLGQWRPRVDASWPEFKDALLTVRGKWPSLAARFAFGFLLLILFMWLVFPRAIAMLVLLFYSLL